MMALKSVPLFRPVVQASFQPTGVDPSFAVSPLRAALMSHK